MTPEQVADAIIADLCDRRGLSQEWNLLDDEIAAEIREAWHGIVRGAMPKWQTIETAPKDGKEVLIWNRNGWEIASYHEAEEDAPDQPGHDAGWIGTYAHPGRSEKDEDFWEAQGQPTLWMPMPPVPDDDNF